ncbi:hypothetical protein Moror_4741 [Moniliophthora roreri MCA 2997]|uniref:Uncharacterized protein n=1 Tax=Moniliophthora roreri (strain MCA 2997) TaxID=1381753 RepID=V2YKK0_MONRO|nr:hypothetical protein Moror_4741 [Moniliophthora roreri MCA 2997]
MYNRWDLPSFTIHLAKHEQPQPQLFRLAIRFQPLISTPFPLSPETHTPVATKSKLVQPEISSSTRPGPWEAYPKVENSHWRGTSKLELKQLSQGRSFGPLFPIIMMSYFRRFHGPKHLNTRLGTHCIAAFQRCLHQAVSKYRSVHRGMLMNSNGQLYVKSQAAACAMGNAIRSARTLALLPHVVTTGLKPLDVALAVCEKLASVMMVFIFILLLGDLSDQNIASTWPNPPAWIECIFVYLDDVVKNSLRRDYGLNGLDRLPSSKRGPKEQSPTNTCRKSYACGMHIRRLLQRHEARLPT